MQSWSIVRQSCSCGFNKIGHLKNVGKISVIVFVSLCLCNRLCLCNHLCLCICVPLPFFSNYRDDHKVENRYWQICCACKGSPFSAMVSLSTSYWKLWRVKTNLLLKARGILPLKIPMYIEATKNWGTQFNKIFNLKIGKWIHCILESLDSLCT